MKLFTVETRNFTFQVFANSVAEFKTLFLKAWKLHLKQHNTSFDQQFFDDLVDEANYIDVKQAVFRDGELLMSLDT